MKHILSLLTLVFLFGCATSQVEAQSAKTKVQSKIASYEAEKTLDDIKWYDGEPEGIQLIQIKISENILNAYPELRDKRVGFGMTNRIIEVLEEAGRFYFVEEKDEVINKMVKEWERSVSGLGTSAKEGEGVLKNLDMSFDQSTVSFATTGAVITAVANVLRRLEKRGW